MGYEHIVGPVKFSFETSIYWALKLLENLAPIELHSGECVQPFEHHIYELMLVRGLELESGLVGPSLAVHPLDICFILANEGVGNGFGRQQIQVDATVELLVE